MLNKNHLKTIYAFFVFIIIFQLCLSFFHTFKPSKGSSCVSNSNEKAIMQKFGK